MYASWSDGFSQSHSITAAAAATYTATYTAVSGGPNLITNYTYDLWGNLTQVSMPRSAGTQTRTFVYSGKYLMSATNPENGTVNYTYTANGKLRTKTDAKGQQIVYTYDAYLRLTQIQRYPTPGNEDVGQRTTFVYDSGSFSQNSLGRLTAVQYSAGYYAMSEQYSYTPAGLMTGKRLAVTANVAPGAPRTVNMDTFQTYDNEGKALTVTYPDGKAYTTAYDAMARPISLTDNQSTTWVSSVQYGLSSELLQIYYAGYGETRTYNSRLQLTQVGSMQYTYSPTQNNGQVTRQNDLASGEEVTYTYDSLSRLIGAVTTDSPTVTQWGQAFTYDGFGNRTSASVTKGSAPYGNFSYDPATNRMLGGYYDANGNLSLAQVYGAYTGYIYDVENRLVSVPAAYNPGDPYQTEQYAYAPGNKRVWRRMSDGTEELYLYGISGQKLGTYKPFIYTSSYVFSISTIDTNLYFGSRTIVSRGVTVQPDRLGSNRAGGSRYFPYGEEQQVTAQDRDKFATYYRDGTTGLDYAQNRYYASTLGRFTSPDPFQAASAGPEDPQSWNQYVYTRSDPVNRYDPSGLDDQSPEQGPSYIWNPPGSSQETYGGGITSGWGPTPSGGASQDQVLMFSGGGGNGGDPITTNNARALLKKRLTGFRSSNCWKILSHEGVKVKNILKNYSNENFWDVRNGTSSANLTISQIGIQSSDSRTLANILGSSDAKTVGALGSASTTAVLLGAQYFYSGNTDDIRMNSLLHEMLHALGGFTDSQILTDQYFLKNGLVNKGFDDTSGISDWLSSDCKK